MIKCGRFYEMNAVIFFFVLFSAAGRRNGELHCYMGHTDETMLLDTPCDTGLVYNHTVRGTNHTTTQLPGKPSYNCPDAKEQPIKYCLIFKYDKTSKADFMCDCHRQCQQNSADKLSPQNFTIQQFSYDGSQGALYCCSGPLCNQRSIESTLQTHNMPLTCLVGNGTKTHNRSCESRSCLVSTPLEPKSAVQEAQYNCDVEDLCAIHKIADNTCQTVPADTGKKTLCCCSSDVCNNDTLRRSVPFHALSTMATPLPGGQISERLRHWMFIGGVAAGVVLGLLVFLFVAVYIRQYKQKRNAQMTYTYAQLTEDLADDREPLDVADERMLLG